MIDKVYLLFLDKHYYTHTRISKNIILKNTKKSILLVDNNLHVRKNMCTEDEFEPENTEKCPDCKTFTIKISENRSYEYCTQCGLITRASYDYAAGIKIHLPYGILII